MGTIEDAKTGDERCKPPAGQGGAARVAVALLVCTALWACTFSAVAGSWHTVAYVNDGDTVTLAGADRQSVRYLGIDTPEIDHNRHTAQPLGYAARKFNRDLVLNQRVRLEFDKERTDRYGRWLAYVYLADGTFVNRALLARGYGYFYSKKPNTRHTAVLLEAQRSAMEAGAGIWRDWREDGESYIGNRHSRLLHRYDCPNARKISPRNRIVFSTRWDALRQGYAPARGCRR